jgi:hypothetical protein
VVSAVKSGASSLMRSSDMALDLLWSNGADWIQGIGVLVQLAVRSGA